MSSIHKYPVYRVFMGLLAAVFLVDDIYEEKAREKTDGSKWTTNFSLAQE